MLSEYKPKQAEARHAGRWTGHSLTGFGPYLGASEWTVCLLAPEAWVLGLPTTAGHGRLAHSSISMLVLFPLPSAEAEAEAELR